MTRRTSTNTHRDSVASSSNDAWVMLAFARDRAEAEVYSNILAEFDIPAQLQGVNPGHAAAMLADAAYEVFVPANCEMRAGEIVAGKFSEAGLHPVCDGGDDDDIEFEDDDDIEDDDDDDDMDDEDFDEFDEDDLDDDDEDEDFDVDSDEEL